MEFTVEQRITATVEAVQQALIDAAFIAACAALPRLGGCELLEDRVASDRAHLRIRRRFTGELNRAVTAIVDPAKLTWVEEIDYDLAARTGTHEIVPDNYADRLTCSYSTRLIATDDGTRRLATGQITVRAPLGAGRVERAIVSGLDEYAQAEARLLSGWDGSPG